MKKIKIIILMMLFVMLLTACNNSQAPRELTQREAGMPYSDWELGATGSAKYLDGKSLLISIYLCDRAALWTSEDERLSKNNLNIACQYLAEQGKKYGKNVELIYDTELYPDLAYYYDYTGTFSGSTVNSEDVSGKVQELLDGVDQYIENNIPTRELMEKYQVNSIAYIVFIDGEADAATAYSYYFNLRNYDYEEVCFINLRWTSGMTVNPDTYAHEILHLFGARDLYFSDSAKGITEEFVKYTSKKYPKDIMLGNAAKGVSWKDKITCEITPITAYFIGWKEYIYEVDEFPLIERRYPASSYYDEYKDYDYKLYTAKARKMEEEQFKKYIVSCILAVALIIFNVVIFARHIITYNRRRKENANLILNSAIGKEPEIDARIKDVFFDFMNNDSEHEN